MKRGVKYFHTKSIILTSLFLTVVSPVPVRRRIQRKSLVTSLWLLLVLVGRKRKRRQQIRFVWLWYIIIINCPTAVLLCDEDYLMLHMNIVDKYISLIVLSFCPYLSDIYSIQCEPTKLPALVKASAKTKLKKVAAIWVVDSVFNCTLFSSDRV